MLTELARRRDLTPDRVAVRTLAAVGDTVTTWAQLFDRARSVAAAAAGLGAGPVVVVVDASAAAAASIIGLSAAGCDVLLVEERSSYLTDSGSAIHRLQLSTVVGPRRAAPAPLRALAYDDLHGTGDVDPGRAPGDILQLTSGSTGEPRVARQPLANVVHGGRTYRDVFGWHGEDVILAAVPLAHSFGLVGGLAAAVCSGASLWTLAPFSLRQLRTGLDEGATAVLGTPLVYRLLLPILPGSHRPPALRTALSSGGPLPAHLGGQVRGALGVPVRQIYGSTEAGLIAYQPPGEDWPADAVGVAAPGVELRLKPSEDGTQLLVRSPSLFRGYAGAPGTLTPDGFYDTGDMVTVDGHGRIFVVGRKDTFINVGGRKVNPRRIERILGEYDGVREVFVYGLDGEEEQRIHAAVVLDPDTAVADVIEFGRARQLMPYEMPHRFHVLDQLPRTGMGKVDRQRVIAAADMADNPAGRQE